MLKRIYIHNFRTFVNFEWHVPPACVLVGDNGSGKSSLIEILWMLQDVVISGVSFEATALPSGRTAWSSDPEQAVEIDVEHGGQSFRYRLSYRWENGRGAAREELRAGESILYRSDDGTVELFDEPPTSVVRARIPFRSRSSFLAVLEPRLDNQCIMAFREALRSIWAVKPDPRRLGAPATAEAHWLERDLSNFADWYRAKVEEDPDARTALLTDLKRTIIGFDQIRLERITPDVKDLRVRFVFGERTHELTWASLSDGQRLLIALYGAFRFALGHAGLIALDEIENYVAPGEIQPWLRVVGDATAAKGTQLLVVSHHPESIDYMAADAAWRMWRDPAGGHSRIERMAPDREVGETAYDLVKSGDSNG